MDRFEFFTKLPRIEPGCATFTSQYLTKVPLKASDRILDLAAGAGQRATWVARSRGSRIVAVERDPRFLPAAMQTAREGGAGHLVSALCARYDKLPFREHAFAAVLAEGAALRLGLKNALSLWRHLVPPQGFVCVTYPGVVNKNAPTQVRAPLEARMIEPLATLPEYVETVNASGYELVHQVPLHPDLWDKFYADNVRHAWALHANAAVSEDDPTVRDVLAEARWYRRVGRGRVFLQAFVCRRVR